MYLSMPILSTVLESARWAPWRRTVAIAGTVIAGLGFVASSWSTQTWHLILLQGVVAALGCAMLYTPTTLWLDEWFRGGDRATAWGVQLASKNVVGTGTPFLISALLDNIGFRWTIRVWALIVVTTGALGIFLVPRMPPLPGSGSTTDRRAAPKIPWGFLKHRTFYIHAVANVVFSSGYGLPQTYLTMYARRVVHLSLVESVSMISIFNAPGIISCVMFGLLNDRTRLRSSTITMISALGSAVTVFLLWGSKSHTIPGLLIAFTLGYGFFASAYSTTWGGWIKDLEREAADCNEAINTGIVYGLLNGARGIGYVVGGLSGVELLDAGGLNTGKQWALGTRYGSLMLFTGLSAVVGGWGWVWRCCGKSRLR